VLVVVLFGVVTIRLLLRAARSREVFPQLAGAGLALVIGLQAFINMGVSLSVLPAKGMTLPLISYGGSSLFAVALTLGFALGLTRHVLSCLKKHSDEWSVRACRRGNRLAIFSSAGAGRRIAASRPPRRRDDGRARPQLRAGVSGAEIATVPAATFAGQIRARTHHRARRDRGGRRGGAEENAALAPARRGRVRRLSESSCDDGGIARAHSRRAA
jgi:hypothetical protein